MEIFSVRSHGSFVYPNSSDSGFGRGHARRGLKNSLFVEDQYTVGRKKIIYSISTRTMMIAMEEPVSSTGSP